MNEREFLSKAIRILIKEELKHYDKEQFKNVKTQKPQSSPVANQDVKAVEMKGLDTKKKELLEAITAFVIEYNNNHWCKEEIIEKLMEVGKIINVKKSVVESNIQTYGQRPKIYAFEVAQLLAENPVVKEDEDQLKHETPSAEKKNDPEKPKEIKDTEREEGKTEKGVEKSNVKDTIGQTEKASGKPKGVKLMSMVLKTAKGVKKMGKNSK